MDNEITPLTKKSHSSQESFELLEELIEEILARLPAKSLLRFRCVSKSWHSLMGNKLFIKKHLQNITKLRTYAHWTAIYQCELQHELKKLSLQSNKGEPSLDPSDFDDPKNNHVTAAGAIVVGHCHGVLCILRQPGSFFLWNPTTRISIELPKLELKVTKHGFGWDEGNDAYKVFAVVSDNDQNIGKLYSSKTDSWKTVDHGCLPLYDKYAKFGIFANGKIHWLKEGGLHIETFDLNTEVFGMIDHPLKPKVGESLYLDDDTEGWLHVVCENTYTKACKSWLMKKDGVKDSWVEKVLTYEEFPCCEPVFYYIESLVSPISEKEK